MRRSYLTHTLEKERDEIAVTTLSEDLALVDLESYPAFIGKNADYFDLMAHLSNQMRALTMMAWKAPEHALNFRLCLTGNDLILEQTQPHRVMIASGNVRSYGQLLLTTHDRLFDSAQHSSHNLLRVGSIQKNGQSQLLKVPPGIYSIYIYYHAILPYQSAPQDDYTILLRHYPFPPHRVAPIRLSGLVPV